MKRLLLIGAGHAHAQVLRDWWQRPVRGVELVLVSPAALAPYSGMVPGWLAGTYRYEDICIDFAALAAAAGARLVLGEMVGLDTPARQVLLASGETLPYDLLSLNTGSTLTPPDDQTGNTPAVLSLRPLGRLQKAWEQQLAAITAWPVDRAVTITAVGGGAAGFESLLAVMAHVRKLQPGCAVQGQLVTRANSLLSGLAPGAGRAAQNALAQAGVSVRYGILGGEDALPQSDLLLWATGAQAHAWQSDPHRNGGLAVSETGFIAIDEQLRSVSHPEVYAVGDCAHWVEPLPKAGVYAVRMGPVLSHNLRAALCQGTAMAYQPQHRFLALLATADGRAIGAWDRWSAQGRWLWRWKDRIDRGFLNRFRVTAHSQRSEPLIQPGDPS